VRRSRRSRHPQAAAEAPGAGAGPPNRGVPREEREDWLAVEREVISELERRSGQKLAFPSKSMLAPLSGAPMSEGEQGVPSPRVYWARNNRWNRRETTRTGRKNPGRHDTQHLGTLLVLMG
jgi:hypothetical protein